MSLTAKDRIVLLCFGLTSLWTFVVFGYDKWLAGRKGGQRMPESTLCMLSALGGWPGGMLGILVFRHKSAKASFQLKFAVAFFIWAALVFGALHLIGRI